MKHMVKRTISLCSPRSEVQGKNWTESHGKQLICTARSPGNEEKSPRNCEIKEARVEALVEAGWEVGKFRVGKNYWTSTNLRETGVLLGGLLRCSERKSVRPRYHGGKISGGVYCAFHKHEQPRSQSSSGISDVTSPVKTREVQKRTMKHWNPLEKVPLLRFFLRGRGSVHWLIEIYQSQITNCFLRGPLRWLKAAKNANVSWALNFKVRVLLKSAVKAALFLNMPWHNQICKVSLFYS